MMCRMSGAACLPIGIDTAVRCQGVSLNAREEVLEAEFHNALRGFQGLTYSANG